MRLGTLAAILLGVAIAGLAFDDVIHIPIMGTILVSLGACFWAIILIAVYKLARKGNYGGALMVLGVALVLGGIGAEMMTIFLIGIALLFVGFGLWYCMAQADSTKTNSPA